MLYKFKDTDGDTFYVVDRVITGIRPSKNRPQTVKGKMGEIVTDNDVYKLSLTPDEILEEIKRQELEHERPWKFKLPEKTLSEEVILRMFPDGVPEQLQKYIDMERKVLAEQQTPDTPPPLMD